MKISRTYLLWTLGLLTAFGPYITDLYLSSLPEQVEYFGTTPALVQLGLTTSMAGLAVGQLVIGPLIYTFPTLASSALIRASKNSLGRFIACHFLLHCFRLVIRFLVAFRRCVWIWIIRFAPLLAAHRDKLGACAG